MILIGNWVAEDMRRWSVMNMRSLTADGPADVSRRNGIPVHKAIAEIANANADVVANVTKATMGTGTIITAAGKINGKMETAKSIMGKKTRKKIMGRAKKTKVRMTNKK